jgi:hypothetical protein
MSAVRGIAWTLGIRARVGRPWVWSGSAVAAPHSSCCPNLCSLSPLSAHAPPRDVRCGIKLLIRQHLADFLHCIAMLCSYGVLRRRTQRGNRIVADRIRVGIVGATVTPGGSGWAANAHVPAVQALPNFELKAVCTAHAETAKASAEKFGADLAFHDINQMAGHPEVDLVTVVVRVPWHKESET